MKKSAFWEQVEEVPGPLETPCWIWKGSEMVRILKRQMRPARAAWILVHGAPPKNHMPYRLCQVPGCIRSDHIRWVSRPQWVQIYMAPAHARLKAVPQEAVPDLEALKERTHDPH